MEKDQNIEAECQKFRSEAMCRTCCSAKRGEIFTQLFQTNPSTITASQEVLDEIEFFNLSIAKDDGLPQQICSECLLAFEKVGKFRACCNKSQEYLSTIFGPPMDKSSEVLQNNDIVPHKAEPIEKTPIMESSLESVCMKEEPMKTPTPTPEDVCATIKTEMTMEDEQVNDDEMNRKLVCGNCSRKFETCDELSAHRESCLSQPESLLEVMKSSCDNFAASNKNRCTICNAVFSHELDLVKHIQVHALGKNFSCNKCSRTFNCAQALKKHFLRIHETSDHECAICNEKFTNEHKYKYHMRGHDPSKLFHCETCGKSFMAVHHLRAHDLMHKDLRPFPCKICDKKYRDKRSLETHMRKHSGERPYVCNICNKDFAIRTSYVLHARKHEHVIKDMKDRGFDFKVESSELSKLQVFPYKCKVCHQGFKVAYSLATHIKTHFEKRNCVCNECGKTFKNAPSLKSHNKLVHLKVKNFACNLCDKTFTFSDELKSHKLVHSDEKPFKCETCGKCFKRKNGYVAHERIHTGDIYTCEVCGKSCKSHSRLADHIMTHSSEERLKVQKQIEDAAFKSAT